MKTNFINFDRIFSTLTVSIDQMANMSEARGGGRDIYKKDGTRG